MSRGRKEWSNHFDDATAPDRNGLCGLRQDLIKGPKAAKLAAFVYLFAHCGALRAFLRPNLRRSFMRGSRFR